jgi:hypothetical protein
MLCSIDYTNYEPWPHMLKIRNVIDPRKLTFSLTLPSRKYFLPPSNINNISVSYELCESAGFYFLNGV